MTIHDGQKPELKPIAFLHNDPERFDVIHAKVKELWLKFKPDHVEHYSIPLYSKEDASAAANQFFGNHYAKRYEELAAALISAAPADANAGGQQELWTYRRYGSEPEKGYTIIAKRPNATHGDDIAYLGDGDIAEKAAERICAAHNAALRPNAHTAPEVSADVVRDAERYRKLMWNVDHGFWGVCEHIVVDRLGATDPNWMDDKAMADVVIDNLPPVAAISRMRENGGEEK